MEYINNQDRLKHSLSVARKRVNIANDMNLTIEQQKVCFVIGYNHDVGDEFTDNHPIEHNKVGGEILKSMNFEYWKEIYYHGKIDADTYLKCLQLVKKVRENG